MIRNVTLISFLASCLSAGLATPAAAQDAGSAATGSQSGSETSGSMTGPESSTGISAETSSVQTGSTGEASTLTGRIEVADRDLDGKARSLFFISHDDQVLLIQDAARVSELEAQVGEPVSLTGRIGDLVDLPASLRAFQPIDIHLLEVDSFQPVESGSSSMQDDPSQEDQGGVPDSANQQDLQGSRSMDR